MNAVQANIRKRFKSNEIKQKAKSQKLLASFSELTSCAEFEIVFETKLFVDWVLIQVLVAVEFLNLLHQSEFIGSVDGILVETVC